MLGHADRRLVEVVPVKVIGGYPVPHHPVLPDRWECVETQSGIASWAAETFGVSTPMRAATRMNEEVAELLSKLSIPDSDPQKIHEECADVMIVLCVLAARLGFDLMEEVQKKMAVNRARKWKLDGSGCGQHVE
jgi:NTP pyrophosphatase (non-canonical NTP hydrolase)